ncbi:UBA/TS-N domain protein [Aspergillus lucknowensis]|uniref:UBA domain-containing protein n=1 Tax=Aspergillus lucknowensis TaxID=176173 RepID=A0ABR4LQ36_9EURO
MDDLNGISWSSSASNDTRRPPPMNSGLLFPSVRRNDASGRSTPLSASSGPSNPPSKSATPSGDSFANLVSFESSNFNKNISLVERQKRLQEEKAKKEAENRARYETQYGGQNSQFWDTLGSSGSGKPTNTSAAPPRQRASSPDEDDLLAAFSASAPVDASTHFPIPSPGPSPQVPIGGSQSVAGGPISMQQSNDMSFIDDDDPFGLNQMQPKSQPAPQPSQPDDDDFLGLLGRPVSELPRPESPMKSPGAETPGRSPNPASGVDRAIAELVDMGFPADKASEALRLTSSGTDVQSAVGLLLTQAHEESRKRTQNRSTSGDHRTNQSSGRQDRDRESDHVPSWMQPERSRSSRSRNETRSPLSEEKDPAQVAANFGNNLLKTANSLWKTGSKRVQQVVNDFSADHDPNQPRWLKEHPTPEAYSQELPQPQPPRTDLTDEALLLESSGPPRPSRISTRMKAEPPARAGSGPRRQEPIIDDRNMRQPAFLQQRPTPESRDTKSRLSRFAVEEQSAQAYVSPARRKRPVPPPSQPNPAQSIDLFDSPAPKPAVRPTPPPSTAQPPRPSPQASTLPARPKPSPRVVPQVSREAITSAHSQREKAAEAYKRGDYAVAHEAFTSALTNLPDKHPIGIVIRSNRAMTALKIGEPKVAISEADIILELIGPAKGEAESIDLCNGEPHKPMKDFYGKALMRKAEALEQLEKWADAAHVWKLAVENGHGGSTSIQGRNRCEKAAGIGKPAPKPSAPARRPAAPPPKKKSSALDDLQGSSSASKASSFEAVNRLREANQAAERNDEEKFALTDSVDARLTAWKGGKQDNLRALLASLDTVLWPEANWKKINMSELIMPSKVKIQYMKGIAKVHPDKIPTNATTEQRMIAGAVFGVLNEAWDKFKAENNL